MDNLENIRNNYFISNPKIINNNNILSKDIFTINPVISLIRGNNFITADLEGRRVKDINEIESDRARRYGAKMDINIEKILEDMKSILVKVPKLDPNGEPLTYPNLLAPNDPGYKAVYQVDEIPVFNLIAKIPTMTPKNKIIALDYGLNDLIKKGISGGHATILSIRTLMGSLSDEIVRQGNVSRNLLETVQRAMKLVKSSTKEMLKQALESNVAKINNKTNVVSFLKKNLFKGSLLSVLLVNQVETSSEKVMNDFKTFCETYKTLGDNDVIEFSLEGGYEFSKPIDDGGKFSGRYESKIQKFYNQGTNQYEVSNDDFKSDADIVEKLLDTLRANNLEDDKRIILDKIDDDNMPFTFGPLSRTLKSYTSDRKTIKDDIKLGELNILEAFEKYVGIDPDEIDNKINKENFNDDDEIFKNKRDKFKEFLKSYSMYTYEGENKDGRQASTLYKRLASKKYDDALFKLTKTRIHYYE
jgi:hypothetical protein